MRVNFPSPTGYRLFAAILILGSAALRIAYLTTDRALDLAPDEAHYWDWSRHLDWSYYSKGPLVAWLIRAGCAIAGPWSEQGSQTLAVRLPAVVCGSLLLCSLYVLTWQTYRRDDLAAAVVALALTVPLVAAGSLLMTIDAPYTCCWGWALVLGHQAVFRRSWWAWPLAGLVVGIGILAKYTMVLWLPSFGLFLLASSEYRRLLFRPGFWVLCAVAGSCCVPIVVWNWQHDWVTLRHVGGQAGVGGSGIRWLGPLAYVGTQCALLLGFWFVAWSAAMIAHRPGRETDPTRQYLWWLSAPMFAVFWLFTLRTAEQPNWPVTAYISGLVLAAGWLVQQVRSPVTWYRWAVRGWLTATILLGFGLTVVMHRSDTLYPILSRIAGPPTRERPLPVRQFDPTCRLRGWRTLAAEVDRLRQKLQDEGCEPILACSAWTLPGELGFYCTGNPTVYSLGPVTGDRCSQYDFWRPHPLADAEQFQGRTFVFVGAPGAEFLSAFEQLDAPQTVTHQENGLPVAQWTIVICRGYRGFTLPQGRQRSY